MSAKKTILIVEGSRTQAERLRLVLQANGYSTTVVTDGREALTAARARQPALIISGVALAGTAGAEGIDGYDMCAALKQDAKLRHIPVVLLTALSDIDDLIRGLKSRVDYCIAKPYQEEDLLARVSTIMSGLVQTVAARGTGKTCSVRAGRDGSLFLPIGNNSHGCYCQPMKTTAQSCVRTGRCPPPNSN